MEESNFNSYLMGFEAESPILSSISDTKSFLCGVIDRCGCIDTIRYKGIPKYLRIRVGSKSSDLIFWTSSQFSYLYGRSSIYELKDGFWQTYIGGEHAKRMFIELFEHDCPHVNSKWKREDVWRVVYK
jgi:hypothetical protein